MTVYELCELFSDAATVEIFSFEKGEAVFLGWSDEIPENIGCAEIASIDPVFPESQHLTINID